MKSLKLNTFIAVFFIFVYQLSAQETYYMNEAGTFIDSDEKASVKLIVENEGLNQFILSYSVKNKDNWSQPEFLQTAREVLDSVYHISASKNMKDYSVRRVTARQGDVYSIRQFDKNGMLEFECQALNVFPLVMNGKNRYFDQEALPMAEESYVRGRRFAEQLLFNPVDSTKEITKEPEFPGGIEEFRKHIARNIRYPIEAMKRGGSGQSYVKFKIDENGKMTDVHLVRSPENELSKELIRVIKSIKTVWQPAGSNGEKIAVWYYATVKFVSGGVIR